GGTLSVSSSLNRIDVFGDSRQVRYASVPASISYSQHTIGYNPFKWRKRIEPLRFQSADRGFVTRMEEIGSQTVGHYFDMLATQARQALSRQNLAQADTLYGIANARMGLGTVGQSELLQLRLNLLRAQNRVTPDSVDAVLARPRFARYLLLPTGDSWRLELPDDIRFFEVRLDTALAQARANSQRVTDFRLRRLEAEQGLAEAKAENSLKFNVQANFGLSNTALTI